MESEKFLVALFEASKELARNDGFSVLLVGLAFITFVVSSYFASKVKFGKDDE